MIRVLLAEDEELIRVAQAPAHRPDVAVVDLEMPHLDGLGVVAELARALPSCAVVILTGHGRPLVLRRVHEGQRYVDPILAADALTAPESPLTPREAEVLAAAGPDRPVREVARALFLSPGTVRNYLAAVTAKLGAPSRAAAYRSAREQGWI